MNLLKAGEMKILDANLKYVLNCGDAMVDLIIKNTNYTMAGSEQVLLSWEEIISQVERFRSEEETPELGLFLIKVEESILGEVSDVIFMA